MTTRVTPFDKTADSSSGTTLQSNAVSVQAGDLICVGVRWEGGTTTCTVTDNKGNTYTPRPQIVHGGGDFCMQVFYANANGTYGDLLITATHSAARPWRQIMCHFSRHSGATDLAFDSDARASGTGTAIATGSFSVSPAGGIAITFVGPGDVATYTPGSGWTEQFDDGGHMEDQLLTGSEGTINGQATASASIPWTAHAISFKEAAEELTATLAFTGDDKFIDENGVAVASATLTFYIWHAARPDGAADQILTGQSVSDGEVTLNLNATGLSNGDPLFYLAFAADGTDLFAAGERTVAVS